MIKGIFRDMALVVEEEWTDKCTKRPAATAAKIVKCLLSQPAANRFFAVNVLKKKAEEPASKGLETEAQEE